MKKPKILIADDDLLLLEAIAAALAEPGRTIVTAHDSETLIEALAGEVAPGPERIVENGDVMGG